MGGRTDGRTDGRMDGRTDGRSYRRALPLWAGSKRSVDFDQVGNDISTCASLIDYGKSSDSILRNCIDLKSIINFLKTCSILFFRILIIPIKSIDSNFGENYYCYRNVRCIRIIIINTRYVG